MRRRTLDELKIVHWIPLVLGSVLMLIVPAVTRAHHTERHATSASAQRTQRPRPSARAVIATGPRAWALATTALLTYGNGQRVDMLPPGGPTDSVKIKTRRILHDWWGIDSRADLLATLDRLDREGHRADFQRRAQMLVAMNDAQYQARLKTMSRQPQVVHQMKIARAHYRKHRGNSFVAWDYSRYIMLCRWGYNVGFLSEDEAWRRIMPAARKIQSGFSSWADLANDYLTGRELWSSEETGRTGKYYRDVERWLVKAPGSPWTRLPWRMNLAG